MSNLPLFLLLVGYMIALAAWVRSDMHKRFDEQRDVINKCYDKLNTPNPHDQGSAHPDSR